MQLLSMNNGMLILPGKVIVICPPLATEDSKANSRIISPSNSSVIGKNFS